MSDAEEYNRQQFTAGILTWGHITEAIRRAQIASESSPALTVDGKAGPRTRMDLERTGRLGPYAPLPAPPTVDPDELLRLAGERAVRRLIDLWSLDVFDPKASDKSEAAERNRKLIDAIVRSDAGAGWNWLDPYRGDGAPGNPEWCGMTAAFGYGAELPLDTRRTWFPSCYRLDRWARYEALDDKHPNKKPAQGPYRMLCELDEHSTPKDLTFTPRAGDIAIVGDGRPVWGDHVTMVVSYDASTGTLHTIEGNGSGMFSNGTRGHGIVKGTRPIGARRGHTYIARRLIRLAPNDLVPVR